MKKMVFLLSFLFFAACTTYSPIQVESISAGNVTPVKYGPSVRIWDIENLDEGPVVHVLARELARGGYSLLEDDRYGMYFGGGTGGRLTPFDNGYWARYFPRERSGSSSRSYGCSACDRADYLLKVGARPVGGSSAGAGAGVSRWPYGASARGVGARNEVEIYLTLYDGRTGRAVPGKSARARVRVGSYTSLAGEIIAKAVGVDAFGESYTYDPWTEAALRAIPQLIDSEGRR